MFLAPWRERVGRFHAPQLQVMHDELYTVKVRISPGWARWVGEKIWHESQKVSKLPDESIEITFRVAGLDEIKRWILSLGPEVVVLEPERLKEMVRKDLYRTFSRYPGSRNDFNLVGESRAI